MPLEDLELRFWRRTVAVGGWLTLMIGVTGLAYGIFVGEPRYRPGVCAVSAASIALMGLATWWVPWGRIIVSAHREIAVLCWSGLLLATTTLLAACDGGAESPFAMALVLPALFTSSAFSLGRVVLIGALSEASFLALAAGDFPGAGSLLVFSAVLAAVIVVAVWQARSHREWRDELTRTSRTDPLTGLLNRRGLASASAAAFDGLSRSGRTNALLLLDLDDFKDYNDHHGHHAGDELLRWVARELEDTVRPSDAVGRLGGDEFAILLPDSGPARAVPVVDRLTERLRPRVGFSLGCAFAPEDGESFDELYLVADADLYRRKARH